MAREGRSERLSVLAIGSHPDDIEFGCGGALLRHVARGDSVTMLVASDGERGGDPAVRIREQREAAKQLGAELVMLHLPDGNLGAVVNVVEAIEPVVRAVAPDLVYTHAPVDTHQDHVTIHQAVRAAAREVISVLEFESPRSLMAGPVIFVDISSTIDEKVELLGLHESQCRRSLGLSSDAVRTRAKAHGLSSMLGHAEAFVPIRFEWRLESAV
jgi:LmbE family N-acetylglucosaminyl deacetylase